MKRDKDERVVDLTTDHGHDHVRSLWQWCQNNFHIHNASPSSVYVVTPFLDGRNDALCYAIESLPDGTVVIHDNNSVLNELEMMGCDVSHGKRKELLQRILNRNNVHLDGRKLFIHANVGDLDIGQFRMLKCMQDLQGLAMLSRSNVAQVFQNDFERWLVEQNVRYRTHVPVKGPGYSHTFDFVVHAESAISYCQVLRHFDKSKAKDLALTASDLKPVLDLQSERTKCQAELVALVDDRRGKITSKTLEKIERLGFKPVGFQAKDDLRATLHLN